MKISAVVNTYNEEANIARCLTSLTWADEIIVWDAESTDKTVEIAKTFTPNVSVHHYDQKYVEPQRNDAIAKASGDWILIVDADEEIPESLKEKLIELANKSAADVYNIPRKNIIFNKWMEHSGWWPDYQLRFFKKGAVTWQNMIHSKPVVNGECKELEAAEKYAIVHHNYDSVEQFITKLNAYTSIQAQELIGQGQSFQWEDLIRKPHDEFLQRLFAMKGYEDGVHGLLLSSLQAFSFLAMYAKVWQANGFTEPENLKLLGKFQAEFDVIKKAMDHWFGEASGKKPSVLKRLLK